MHIKNAPIADKTMRAGENKSRVMKRGLDLAFLFAPPKYQGLCLLIGLCNRAFSIRRRLTFCKNGWSGFMCYHQRFRDRYVYPLRGVPYFVPPTKASSIRTYSIVSVPYHLCLAVVFGHHPTGGSYPTSMYFGRARRKSNPERFTATFPYVLKIRTACNLRPVQYSSIPIPAGCL